jgi:hypothetical protein
MFPLRYLDWYYLRWIAMVDVVDIYTYIYYIILYYYAMNQEQREQKLSCTHNLSCRVGGGGIVTKCSGWRETCMLEREQSHRWFWI